MRLVIAFVFLLLTYDARGIQHDGNRIPFHEANLGGYFNNPSHVEWGSAYERIESYYGPAYYLDGTHIIASGPNPRSLTNTLFRGSSGIPSTKFTTMFAFFGQLISREIMDIDEPGCPREIVGVNVSSDMVFSNFHTTPPQAMTMMPVYRSKYDKCTGTYPGNPRKQLNGVTSWIDGSFIYGPFQAWTDALRTFDKGLFNLDSRNLPPKNTRDLPLDNFPPPRTHKLTKHEDFWAVGNRRAHENPALLSLSILFMRYHNVLAKKMAAAEETPSPDRQLFAKTRSKVIAVLQSIIFYEWLPLLLGDDFNESYKYTGYSPAVSPNIDSLYAAVASQWIMTLIPPAIPVKSPTGCYRKNAIRLCESWFDGQKIINDSSSDLVREIILGLMAQPAEKEDTVIVEDLLDYSYGPLHFSRMDAAAEHIVRGRDFGIKAGHVVLENINIKDWDDLDKYFSTDPDKMSMLKSLYNNDFSSLDLFVVCMLPGKSNSSGGANDLVKKVFGNQLKRIRDADFFWFENEINRLFTTSEIEEIRNTKLYDVVTAVFGEQFQLKDAFSLQKDKCQFPPLDANDLIPCSPLKTFDYFAGNEFAYIISWIVIGLFPFVVVGLAYGCYQLGERNRKKHGSASTTILTQALVNSADKQTIIAEEWVGGEEVKIVRVNFAEDKYIVYVKTLDGMPLRSINMNAYEVLTLHVHLSAPYTVLLELPKSYDLVLRFIDHDHLSSFSSRLGAYTYTNGKLLVRQPTSSRNIMKKAITKEKRKSNLDQFFRNVFAQAFRKEIGSFDTITNREFIEFEISKEEFADSLGMNPKSMFVELMFNMADKQKRGFLRYREILELVIIMSQGSPDRKLELLFDMFDFNGNGLIARNEVHLVVRSLVDLAGSYMDQANLDQIVEEMYSCAGLSEKDNLDFNEFKALLTSRDEHFIDKVGFDWKGVNKTTQDKRRSKLFQKPSSENLTMDSLDEEALVNILHSKRSIKNKRHSDISLGSSGPASSFSTLERQNGHKQLGAAVSLKLKKKPMERINPRKAKLRGYIRYIENRKRELSVLFVFYSACVALFLERFMHYVYLNEHVGVRQTLSLGVAFARGGAEVCSFTFSLLLVTMCYNMVRFLRETFINLYIPFDKNIVFHKIVAWTGLAFAAVHTIAYGFNYYFLASGPASHACFFDTLVYPSDAFIRVGPTLYATLPGITGVLLVLVLILMYIFASQTTRTYMHNTFWIMHKLFIALYVLMALHGLIWLTQKPNFYAHFIGPCLLFIADRTMSVTRRKMKLDIIHADLLPSSVTKVMFKRPTNFEYKSGMWVRIACDALTSYEYHPFTLTSAPHEDYLSLHIRGVGPWTLNIRRVLQTCLKEGKPFPCVYVDGPFGSGQQDWYNFEVSVLVGAGIGVTPYASILKDFVHMMRTKNRFKVKCQKVYFIWSTSNQKSFEWFIDILKQVEEVDINCTVSVNIFITQFFQSFDLRTSMLYVFEEHAKRVGGCSLFTGLKATTNFGRPNFNEIFQEISEQNLRVKNVGVFSCGPPGLTKGVEQACVEASAKTHSQFQHHYENF